ncbi:MAG: AI-2E family transporter [archaeon]
MAESKIAKYFLIGLVLLFIYLAALVVMPVFKNILLALVLAFAFYPVYKVILGLLKYKNLSTIVMILLLFLLIIIPSGLIVTSLIKQTSSAYSSVAGWDFTTLNSYLPDFIANKINLNILFEDIFAKTRNFIVNSAPNFIESVAEIMLGLFVMFFVMFYAFRDGEKWIEKVKTDLPMKKAYTQNLLSNTASITKGVLYGYLLTAAIQGTLGGLIFWMLGISNPVLWGFVMMILASIPFLGTPIVFVPIAIIEIMNGHLLVGITLLLFGFFILINIDNLIRPKLISSKTKVHPALILIGIIGGLAVFGFIGIILGPMILSLLMVIVKFFVLEFEN